MPKSGRFNPQQATVDQQGAQGRLTSNTSQPPILTPRTSKVPAQDGDFLTTSQGVAFAELRRLVDTHVADEQDNLLPAVADAATPSNSTSSAPASSKPSNEAAEGAVCAASSEQQHCRVQSVAVPPVETFAVK